MLQMFLFIAYLALACFKTYLNRYQDYLNRTVLSISVSKMIFVWENRRHLVNGGHLVFYFTIIFFLLNGHKNIFIVNLNQQKLVYCFKWLGNNGSHFEKNGAWSAPPTFLRASPELILISRSQWYKKHFQTLFPKMLPRNPHLWLY